MSSIEDLTNEFSLIQGLYEKEKDLKVKEVFRKQLLEIAKEIGYILLQDQITEV
ncbi:MAG: hypothetical protein ACYC0Q_12770 [Eubacteriales bacterium]